MKLGTFSKNSLFEEVKWGDQKLGEYLRELSGNNDWYSKSFPNCCLYYTANGKCVVGVFYSGAKKDIRKVYALKNRK